MRREGKSKSGPESGGGGPSKGGQGKDKGGKGGGKKGGKGVGDGAKKFGSSTAYRSHCGQEPTVSGQEPMGEIDDSGRTVGLKEVVGLPPGLSSEKEGAFICEICSTEGELSDEESEAAFCEDFEVPDLAFVKKADLEGRDWSVDQDHRCDNKGLRFLLSSEAQKIFHQGWDVVDQTPWPPGPDWAVENLNGFDVVVALVPEKYAATFGATTTVCIDKQDLLYWDPVSAKIVCQPTCVLTFCLRPGKKVAYVNPPWEKADEWLCQLRTICPATDSCHHHGGKLTEVWEEFLVSELLVERDHPGKADVETVICRPDQHLLSVASDVMPCVPLDFGGILLIMALGIYSVSTGLEFCFHCKKNRDRTALARAAYEVGRGGRCGYLSVMLQDRMYGDKRLPSFKMVCGGFAALTTEILGGLAEEVGSAVVWAISTGHRGSLTINLDQGYPCLQILETVVDPPLWGKFGGNEDRAVFNDEHGTFDGRWFSKEKVHSLSYEEQAFLIKGLSEKLRPYQPGCGIAASLLRRTEQNDEQFTQRMLRALL